MLAIEGVAPSMALAIDCGSDINRVPYTAVCASFIDHQWNFRHILLKADYESTHHNSIELQKVITSTLEAWQFEMSVMSGITTDNASTMLAVCNSLVEGGIVDDKVRCVCHTLQLVANQVMSVRACMRVRLQSRLLRYRFRRMHSLASHRSYQHLLCR
jgi:hypothetical protein